MEMFVIPLTDKLLQFKLNRATQQFATQNTATVNHPACSQINTHEIM